VTVDINCYMWQMCSACEMTSFVVGYIQFNACHRNGKKELSLARALSTSRPLDIHNLDTRLLSVGVLVMCTVKFNDFNRQASYSRIFDLVSGLCSNAWLKMRALLYIHNS